MKLSDEQWKRLEPLLLGKQGDPGVSGKNNRQFVDAALWVATHADLWRNLPVEFGKWNTVYMRFKRWNECDVWRQVVNNLADDPELQGMIQKIVAYGDQQILRIKQRLVRQARKNVYNHALDEARGTYPSTLLDIEDSTSHWVTLVTPDPQTKLM